MTNAPATDPVASGAGSPSTPVGNRPRINARALLGRPARQATLRESNLTLVAAHIFAAEGPISRSEIVEASGLTRSTVSRIVDQLLAAAVIEEQRPRQDGRAGRPVLPLVPATNSLVAVGLEVNTASLGGIALDLAGNVVAERVVEGDFIDSHPDAVLREVDDIAAHLLDEIDRVGGTFVGSHLSLPGVVDPTTERLLLAPRLGWQDVDPIAALVGGGRVVADRVRIGSVLPHAALAEASVRRDDTRFLYVAGDNAIGSALVVDGLPFTSRHGWDGNIGHTLIDPTGPPCRCGARGCLDVYVGRRSLLDATGLPPSTSIDDVVELTLSGRHEQVSEVVTRAGAALGVALATYANLVAVPVLVLGDNLARLLPIVREHVVGELEARTLTARFGLPRLELAASGPHAAMIGGALSVLQDLLSDPQGRLIGTKKGTWR
jgi:predicted NBD/HSP70 family sugar kinase